MNKFFALCYFVLSLYGCDVGGNTFIHRTIVDGNDTLHSKVVARPGIARFECVGSASGQCHYTLFARDCAPAAGPTPGATGKRGDHCPSAPVERFAIANGDSRQIPALPRFRVCVSAEAGAPGPDCEAPEPLAAR